MAQKLLGINAKLYRNSATFGSPTWVEMPRVSDVSVDVNWNRAVNATRGSVFERGGKTTAKLQLTFKHEEDLTDVAFLAIIAALNSQSGMMDLLALNASNSTNGAAGYRGEFDIADMKESQGIQDVLIYDVTALPQATGNALQSASVAAGAPVFTTISAN